MLRMEDIDKPRSRPELVRAIIDDLRWLGLDWDEGPDSGGPYGPYEQSLREELYEQAVEKLQLGGWLYPCTCSRAELAAIASAPHGLDSEGPAYPGICRNRPAEDHEARAAFKKPSLRFTMPDKPVETVDEVAGLRRYSPGSGGDFIVKRADGIFSYQLAVVVDDAAMRITDVLRGDDLLDSTPRQLMLYEALGSEAAPRFAHVPLLFGPDGRRLAKRDDTIVIARMRAAGMLPERLVGWLAFWSGLLDQPEPVKASELIAGFDLAKVPKDPVAVRDFPMLKLWNASC